MNNLEGHRERLRLKFRNNPEALTNTEYLELLLTYAIPRRDVSSIARNLSSRFGNLTAIFSAPDQELLQVDGIGESVVTFLHFIGYLLKETNEPMIDTHSKPNHQNPQLNLFELEPALDIDNSAKSGRRRQLKTKTRSMRVFANDEIANSLEFLPKAAHLETLEDFKQYLNEKLPYNAAETRQRRASYILERFFPEGDLQTPLSNFLTHCSVQEDLKPVIFYHVLKAEPIAAKVAEELVWPALPIGRIEREQIREFVLRYLPDASASSQDNMLRSIFYTYNLLAVGSVVGTNLHFHLHTGSLAAFLYILTSEYPRPGIYSYDSLYQSPVHRWLLWDQEWIRRQLYNLRDLGILAKVSEIDTVKQYTLAVDQSTALNQYFETIQLKKTALRDASTADNTSTEHPASTESPLTGSEGSIVR